MEKNLQSKFNCEFIHLTRQCIGIGNRVFGRSLPLPEDISRAQK